MAGTNQGIGPFTPDNPDAPYFEIKIGEKIYDISINYIESLTLERMQDDIGKFNFTIFDYSDYTEKEVGDGMTLEDRFMQVILDIDGGWNVSFKYGWSKGAKSTYKYGMISDYTPTFLPGGYMKLEVSGTLVGLPEDVNDQIFSFISTSPSDTVQKISEHMGWVIEEIEPTKPYKIPKPVRITNANVVDYIREKLEPNSINLKKEPMKFILDTNNGQDHVYFISVNKSTAAQKNYNFFVNMGNYGSVLSWSPQYSGRLVANQVNAQMASMDSETNEIYCFGANNSSLKSQAGLVISGSTSPENMEALLANKWYQNNIGCLKATLEIVGDPTLKVGQCINVLPMRADGELHLSYGTYMIQKITETIAGDYKTTLELVQQSDENTNQGETGLGTMPLVEAVEIQGVET